MHIVRQVFASGSPTESLFDFQVATGFQTVNKLLIICSFRYQQKGCFSVFRHHVTVVERKISPPSGQNASSQNQNSEKEQYPVFSSHNIIIYLRRTTVRAGG